jgi:hypothetical protein
MRSPTGYENSDKFQIHPWWKYEEDIEDYRTLNQACKIMHYTRGGILKKVFRKQLQGFKIRNRWFIKIPKNLLTP